MYVYNEVSTRKAPTPWGVEVKKRLIDRNMKQQDIVNALIEKGFKVNKIIFSQILHGIGVTARTKEINAVNEMLEIPTGK